MSEHYLVGFIKEAILGSKVLLDAVQQFWSASVNLSLRSPMSVNVEHIQGFCCHPKQKYLVGPRW
jgi:hypothetical protein